jgi:hypothetical protein
MHTWVQVHTDFSLGAYAVYEAPGYHKAPVWPEATMATLLRCAFQDAYIDRWTHPVLRQLRGEL